MKDIQSYFTQGHSALVTRIATVEQELKQLKTLKTLFVKGAEVLGVDLGPPKRRHRKVERKVERPPVSAKTRRLQSIRTKARWRELKKRNPHVSRLRAVA